MSFTLYFCFNCFPRNDPLEKKRNFCTWSCLLWTVFKKNCSELSTYLKINLLFSVHLCTFRNFYVLCIPIPRFTRTIRWSQFLCINNVRTLTALYVLRWISTSPSTVKLYTTENLQSKLLGCRLIHIIAARCLVCRNQWISKLLRWMDDKSSSYNGAKTDFRGGSDQWPEIRMWPPCRRIWIFFSLFGVFPRRRHVLPFFLGPLNILWPHVSSKQ